MTNYNFGQVFDLPIMEFFTYVSYLRYKAAKEEQAIREFKTKHHIK